MSNVTTTRDPLIYEFETADKEARYNEWLRERVAISRAETGPGTEHSVVMAEMRQRIVARLG